VSGCSVRRHVIRYGFLNDEQLLQPATASYSLRRRF